jgi:hypothetical protein
MVTRGRKQKACLIKQNLGETLENTLQEKPPRRGKTLTPPHPQQAAGKKKDSSKEAGVP